MAIVARSFNTFRRRWVAGETVSEADDLTPHTFDDLARRGFIDRPKAVEAPTPAAPQKKSRK